MKIAIFHSFMDNIGGAEIVALTLARELNADIYTTNISPKNIQKMGFDDVFPRIKSIGKVPINAPFRQQITLHKFRKLNLKQKYDFYIIAGDWAMSGGVNNKPNLWYVHSPLHELWEFKTHIRKNILSLWKRPLYDLWVWFNRKLTLKYAEHVQLFACNSDNTKERIKKYYGYKSEVIYPPVYTRNYSFANEKKYWLSVNRLTNQKRVEMQIEAFAKLPKEKLIIVGSYEKGSRQFELCKSDIDKTKPNNVLILNWVKSKDLIKLYSECTGFITTSMKEDFGMSAVEAIASGKPVIAPNENGYREILIQNDTGILIDNIDSKKLINTLEIVKKNLKKNNNHYKDNCLHRSETFDTKNFIKKIKDLITK